MARRWRVRSFVRFDQAKDHAGERGFAAAAFANDGKGFTCLRFEADIINYGEAFAGTVRRKYARSACVAFAQVSHFEQGRHRRTHRAA
jgi:hypothetical protein